MVRVNHGYRSVAFLFIAAASLCLSATGASAELGDVVGLTLGPSNTGTFGSTVHVMNGNRLVVPDRANNIYVYDANRSLNNPNLPSRPRCLTLDPVLRFGIESALGLRKQGKPH